MTNKKTFFAAIVVAIIVGNFSLTNANAATLKIGFITDAEYHSKNTGNKLSTKALSYLDDIGKSLNKKNIDLLIGGGDYILGTKVKEKQAKDSLKKVIEGFETIKAGKRYYLAGNHDFRALSTGDFKNALDINYLHKSFTKDGYRIILLDTNFKSDTSHWSDDSFVEGYVSKKELAWLDKEISDSADPVIIFSHHSPIRPNGRRDIKNSTPVQGIIEKTGKVVAVISGHNPTQYIKEQNGVRYIVINNLVDTRARKTYGYISATIKNGKAIVSVKQYGRVKRTYKFEKTL